MRQMETTMISFSGGRTSAYMTAKLIEQIPPEKRVVCFANTGKEEEATLKFVHQCDELWNGIIHWIEYDPITKFRIVDYHTASRKGEPYQTIIEKRRYLPNVVARYCTQDLKIRPIKWFMKSLGHRNWINAVGIRHDEPQRWAKTKNIASRECFDTWLPLVDWKVDKPAVLEYWRQMPFNLQLLEHEGNCDLCFLKGKNKIKQIIEQYPQKATWWIDQEKAIGATFHKGYSYQQLFDLMARAPTLFDHIDPDFPCFCNID
ncbi:phosphoadenosine phosphosulfate reductase family protein [Chitinophaga sp. CC14]|uniref:phosphoadenosine phosphosulfate reductase domain-containing protein n=1 Tax=Chitinophaga sp. CC14 TaxID=3029199 RepID=UPI003B78A392